MLVSRGKGRKLVVSGWWLVDSGWWYSVSRIPHLLSGDCFFFHYLRPMNSQKKAYTYAFLAIACWSTIGSAFKLSLRYLDPLGLLLFSSIVACLILFLVMVTQGKLHLLKQLTLNQVLNSALMGMLNPYLYYVVLLRAYDLLPAQEAGTLNYIWPLVLVLISIPMLKQRIGLFSVMAVIISFSGILLISTHGDLMAMRFTSTTGVILAVGSAFFWAFYWIINLRDQREAVSKLFLNFCFGLLYVFITIAATKRFFIPPWPGLAGAVYIGIFEMGITFLLWLNALRYARTTASVSNLIYLSPFISLLIIHFAVGEAILPSTVGGLGLIILGILMQEGIRKRSSEIVK
jgi:drug/metabolite transporter (DMT)-like permease